MATLIAYQDGNFTGATTFKAIATGTGATQTTASTDYLSPTTYSYSPTFTLTNGEVIEGVLMDVGRSLGGGTFSIALSDNNGVTATREVTVDVADINTANASFNSLMFFKFATPLTADGGSDYRLGIKSSLNQTVRVKGAASNSYFRIFRKSDTATIATTDTPYISGEWTGAGSVTPITVTMDSTATTSYGALQIGHNGTLSFGTSASTNYYLRLAGNLVVYHQGTLNIGTSTTRIPSTSTATLEFNCSSNVQFGLEALNGSTVNIYGAEKKSWTLLTSTANSGQAVAIVQDTTGWLANDEVILPTTTNIRTDSDRRTIASVDSATQITLSSNLSFTHSGVTNYQGEVGNLTRNVKIRGTSATLQSYVNCAATSSFTADNAEFFFLGSGTTNKRGIDSATTSSGTFLMNGCALRDFSVTNNICVNATGTTGSPSISRCVMVQGQASLIAIGATSGVPIIFQNLTIQTTNAAGVSLSDVGGEVTENRFVAGNPAIAINEASVINIFSNNVIHSSQSGGTNNGFTINNCTGGTIESCDVWRVGTGNGFNVNARITLNNCRSYHNSLANLIANNDLKVTNSVFDGGTGQSIGVSNRHIDLNGSDILFENCDFGQTNQATNFINVTVIGGDATFINCDIAESLTPLNQTNLFSPTSTPVIGFDKLNNTSGNHRAYKRYGYAGSDQSVYRTASPSEVLVPNSASGKLPSGSKKFGVASGNDATVSVWVRKSSTYNGAEPRLILKRNIVGGVSSDQVLDTAIVPMGAYDKPLDTYTGAAGAYSLRKLRTAYSGSAIRVRRSSDNTEQDIGFDANGHLDESALLSFVGSGNGFVRTWYDQSGNARHAEQTTNANQPRIVNGGVADKDKGRPTVRFDGTASHLLVDSLASLLSGEDLAHSAFTAQSKRTTNITAVTLTFSNTGNNTPMYHLFRWENDAKFGYYLRDDANNIQYHTSTSTYVTNTVYARSTISTGLNVQQFTNGIGNGINATFNRGIVTVNAATIGALRRATTGDFFDGNISEIIFYASDQSTNRVPIETSIGDYWLGTVWQELTASTPTVTDDCVLEVYVDADGVQGSVNIDDWSIS